MFFYLIIFSLNCKFNSTETCSFDTNNLINVDYNEECCIILHNCRPGTCYSIFDKTNSLKFSYIEGINKSIFSDIYINSPKYMERNTFGFFFITNEKETNLCFKIQSEINFKKIHQFEKNYSKNNLQISNIIRGLPLCS